MLLCWLVDFLTKNCDKFREMLLAMLEMANGVRRCARLRMLLKELPRRECSSTLPALRLAERNRKSKFLNFKYFEIYFTSAKPRYSSVSVEIKIVCKLL